MSGGNISIFVPHIGCPNMCSFCNQRTISGETNAPTAESVREVCEFALKQAKSPQTMQIAFFGGSFTAIDREYMTELLEAASEFVSDNGFSGIRISTRPDAINEEILGILKHYGVRAIELGAQSMNDEVLLANNRGHSAEDVHRASALIKSFGFELGLQIMTGLYKSTPDIDLDTMREVIRIKPDTVRIYPTVILNGTKLGELYLSGEYKTVSFDDMVKLCAKMLLEFWKNGIKVIRCGLHASDNVSGDQVGGFYHPAFKELCESEVYKSLINEQLPDDFKGSATALVADDCISKALGHKKSNAEYFSKRGVSLKVKGDGALDKYQCRIITQET